MSRKSRAKQAELLEWLKQQISRLQDEQSSDEAKAALRCKAESMFGSRFAKSVPDQERAMELFEEVVDAAVILRPQSRDEETQANWLQIFATLLGMILNRRKLVRRGTKVFADALVWLLVCPDDLRAKLAPLEESCRRIAANSCGRANCRRNLEAAASDVFQEVASAAWAALKLFPGSPREVTADALSDLRALGAECELWHSVSTTYIEETAFRTANEFANNLKESPRFCVDPVDSTVREHDDRSEAEIAREILSLVDEAVSRLPRKMQSRCRKAFARGKLPRATRDQQDFTASLSEVCKEASYEGSFGNLHRNLRVSRGSKRPKKLSELLVGALSYLEAVARGGDLAADH